MNWSKRGCADRADRSGIPDQFLDPVDGRRIRPLGVNRRAVADQGETLPQGRDRRMLASFFFATGSLVSAATHAMLNETVASISFDAFCEPVRSDRPPCDRQSNPLAFARRTSIG
jgi:hypothetical protein